jgi:hypothetical protein
MSIYNLKSRFVDKILSAACAMSITVFCGCRRLPEAIASPSTLLYGHEACDPADSKALCIAVQECFKSRPSAVCRDAERIAIQISKPDPSLYNNGAAKALTY